MKSGILTLLLLAALPAFAEEPPRSAPEPSHPQALALFEKAGGKVSYLGPAHGLEGWVVTNDKGGVQTVYTTGDGALVAGVLFGADGVAETSKQLEALKKDFAEKAPSKAEQLYAQTEKAAWVGIGDAAAPPLYVYMNVTCDHCQEFWKDIAPAVSAGKMQVRLVPYGAQAENRDGGAALLAAAAPGEAWQKFLDGDGSALAKESATAETYQKIDDNTKLVNTWKLGGPPFTLYRRPLDGVLQAVVGRPENPLLLQADFLDKKGG